MNDAKVVAVPPAGSGRDDSHLDLESGGLHDCLTCSGFGHHDSYAGRGIFGDPELGVSDRPLSTTTTTIRRCVGFAAAAKNTEAADGNLGPNRELLLASASVADLNPISVDNASLASLTSTNASAHPLSELHLSG